MSGKLWQIVSWSHQRFHLAASPSRFAEDEENALVDSIERFVRDRMLTPCSEVFFLDRDTTQCHLLWRGLMLHLRSGLP